MSLPLHDPKRFKRFYATAQQIRELNEARERFSHPRIDFPKWALDGIQWRGDERILDIGCGYGAYYDRLNEQFPDMQYFGVDLSEGMLRQHGAYGSGRLAFGEATQLPFASESFDVVMANHMLYHIPDVEAAVREVKRVMKPDGVKALSSSSVKSAAGTPLIHVWMRRP